MGASRKRIRKSTKYFYIVVAIILIIASISNLIKIAGKGLATTRTKQIYSFSNKFFYDYNVNLLANEYISNTNNIDFVYVTDLIDTIDLNLNYIYEADQSSSLDYSYEVLGKIQAYYTKDGEKQKILEQEEVLQPRTLKNEENNKIKITNSLNLNLKSKNTLLNKFKQEMGMAIEAKYIIIFKVDVKTNIEDKDVIKQFESELEIDLAEKTTEIKGENNKEDIEYISKSYEQKIENSIMLVVDIIGIIIAVNMLKYLNKTKVVNRIKNEYKKELNRILQLCQDKIVQISTIPESSSENTIIVKDFGEIIKLSEELFKPILYYYNLEAEEALFIVISNGVTYKYTFKK